MVDAKENIKNDEINSQADALTDLPVTDERAEHATGGGFDPQGRLILGTDDGIWR